MKPGIPWSVKGVGPEVREAAKHAARRSGMTLGEWLNTVILDQAEDSGASQTPISTPAQKEFSDMTAEAQTRARSETTVRLEDIAQQLSQLARREQESAAIRPYGAPGRQADSDMLNRVLSRVEANERQAVEAFTAMNERLSVLARQMAATPQAKPLEKPEDVPGFPALESALRNIVDHIEISERRTRDSLKSMQDRMGDLAHRATQSGTEELVRAAPAFTDLETRLNDLAARVQRNEMNVETGLSDTVRRELIQLAGRIESVESNAEHLLASAQSAASQTAEKELRDIEGRIHALLRDTQATMAAGQVGSADVLHLTAEIASLTQRIEEVRGASASERDVNALKVAVEQISARLAQGPDLRPLADLDRRLADITERLEQERNNPRQSSQLGELERRIAELDHRLADAMQVQGGAHAITALEQQLSDVGSRLATAETQLGHLGTIERAITQLFDGLEQHRSDSARAIDDAAQRAAQQVFHAQSQVSPEVLALQEGLRAVRESADQSDRRSQETLEAVHETLEQIVTKLAELETSAAGHQLAAAMSRQAQAAPEPQPLAAPQWAQPSPAAPAAETSYFNPVTAIPEPQVAQEPPAARVAETQGAEPKLDMPPPADFSESGMTGDAPDDDFIAAARRAAQAAAGRSTATISPAKMPELKRGANSRFGFVLPFKSRPRKPAPAPVSTGPKQVPILDAPGTNFNKRRKLILAGIVLLAAVSAVTFNMLAKGARNAVPPAPVQQTAPATKGETGSLGTLNSSSAIAAIDGLPSPEAAEAVPEITGSLPAAKTDASIASIVAEPGTASSRVEMPPPEVGRTSLREAAAQGDVKAQFIVAGRYLDGEGIEQDVTRAAYWYQEAASRGLAPAQYRIATLFERGKGVPKDVATAYVWYERAAAGGNVKAMHNAAVIAAGNEVGTPDYDKAFRWFSEAASRGLQDSQFNLGVLYERGLGTGINLSEAYFWYTMAAANNDADAQKRADAVAQKLKPEDVAAIKARVKSWTPAPTQPEANVVTVTEDNWNGAGESAATTNQPAPAVEVAPLNPVKAVQQWLMQLGYNVGEPDGKMGGRTANAIRLFQLQSGMKVTGEISPELMSVMEQKAQSTSGA